MKKCQIATLDAQQGSVLCSVLYFIYTSDMPFTEDVVATYADDIALIASSDCLTEASNVIQNYLNNIAIWLKNGIFVLIQINGYT